MKRLKPFKFSAAVHVETIHLICNTNEIAGFYMKCKTELKWHKRFHEGEIIHYKKCKKDFFTSNFTVMTTICLNLSTFKLLSFHLIRHISELELL